MCGIVGYIGSQNALGYVVGGLERLEYRGYDSAGIAFLENNQIKVKRAQGKLANLRVLLQAEAADSHPTIAIGHTRWATHGRPSESNAHPHTVGRVSIIHNGIIENYLELRKKMEAKGSRFLSETDSEVIAHLMNELLVAGNSPLAALSQVCSELRGSYALVVLDRENPDLLLAARQHSPLIIGCGEGFSMVASDIPAVLEHTRQIIFLEEGDIVEVRTSGAQVFNNSKSVQREARYISWDAVTAQKGGYKHYMLKEIHEQPRVVADTFMDKIFEGSLNIDLSAEGKLKIDFKETTRITIVACGTAYYAGLVGKTYFESLAGIPCDVEFASEFRYRHVKVDPKSILIAISQSGETADTLAAVSHVSGQIPTFAVCNALGSSLTRKVDCALYTHAGPEISVASTKAFSTQLTLLYIMAVQLGATRGLLTNEQVRESVAGLVKIPTLLTQVLEASSQIEKIAKDIHMARNCLFIGRSIDYPIALEGALKLKEISYIHAEAFPAGELKHGPLALVDRELPVVVLLPRDQVLFEKTFSNMLEVKAREGRVIAITDGDAEQVQAVQSIAEDVIVLPFINSALSPLIKVIPLQLLAYFVALFKGSDVDQPRNLAKSVTVE
jgi:glucosamine--fructose-6-phosphate aminotransferase (isomerizing)